MIVVIFVVASAAVLATFGIAAMRWGVDTREWTIGTH